MCDTTTSRKTDSSRLSIHSFKDWRAFACALTLIDDPVLAQAQYLTTCGVGHYDALHAACEMAGNADV
jgi:hypothetical protein